MKLTAHVCGNGRGLAAGLIDTGDIDSRLEQECLVAENFLPETNAGPAESFDGGDHREHVVEFCGGQVIGLYRPDHENDAAIVAKGLLLEAGRTEVLRTGAFAEAEVICVVNHPGRVGVFIIDANRPRERGRNRLGCW